MISELYGKYYCYINFYYTSNKYTNQESIATFSMINFYLCVYYIIFSLLNTHYYVYAYDLNNNDFNTLIFNVCLGDIY